MDGDSIFNELAADWGGDDGSELGSAVGDRSRSPTLCPGRSRPPRLLALTSSAWRPAANGRPRRARPRRARFPAPPGNGSAVGDDGSSAASENTRRFTADPSYMGQFSSIAVFAQESCLWAFLESLDMMSNWKDNMQCDIRSDLGDKRLWMFRFWRGTYNDDELKNHYNRTVSDMKTYINVVPDGLKLRLLHDVPARPSASNSLPLTTNAQFTFLGMLSKYNFEYRRPFPMQRNAPTLDVWHRTVVGARQPLAQAAVNDMMAPCFLVPEIEGTFEGQDDTLYVDWIAPMSSMMARLQSAVGDDNQYALFRDVLGINFPCFCYFLKDDFTARQIEEAWLQCPVIRRAKTSRGSTGGGRPSRGCRWK